MNAEINNYHQKLNKEEKEICEELANAIDQKLPEATSKIWHAHPVWFLNENPIVGYSLQKAGIRLMFWSGADFDETYLNIHGKKFKDASVFFTTSSQINLTLLNNCLEKSKHIQWDYKNIVKRKGKLERLM